MKIRALTLGLVSAAALSAALPQAASAQGLRPSGAAQAPRLSPSVTLPAATTGGRATSRSADFIVAVVNSEPITNNDVQIRMERVRAQMAAQGAAQPPEGLLAEGETSPHLMRPQHVDERGDTAQRRGSAAIRTGH